VVRRSGVRLQVPANKPSDDARRRSSASVSYTGTTTLTFTATTDQPLDGGGLWVDRPAGARPEPGVRAELGAAGSFDLLEAKATRREPDG
jgi:hypothetical protein